MGGKKLINPFPGLRPFKPEEADLFFGRESESKEVSSRLIRNRFITVIGSSGSGKSSLIFCGVIPSVVKDNSEKGTSWEVISLRPGNDPLGNLASAFSIDPQSPFLSDKTTGGLVGLVAQKNKGKGNKVLLVIDQFEELFRYKGSRREGQQAGASTSFVRLIVDAITDRDSQIFIIITMRSDFIGECAYFQGLTGLINESSYLVPHMSSANYREAIAGPVEFAGATIEDSLVDLIVDEIGDKTDQLPVLQHAMMRTWDHWAEFADVSKSIGLSDYESVGKMSGAMSKHADEAFDELDSNEQRICEILFKTITEKGNDNKGIRHPTKVKLIADIAGCQVEDLYKVLDKFRSPGRSFITPPSSVDLTSDTIIDVSHESIMRLWDKLSVWVEEEANSVQMYLRLSESAELFNEGKTTLWRPPDLQLAINWKRENNPTLAWAKRFNPAFERAMVYLKTSEKEYLSEEENKIISQKRQLRRSKITAMILGIAAIISVSFMIYAFMKQIEAENNRREADEQRILAREQEQLAVANAEEAKRNEEEASKQRNIALVNADEAKRNAEAADIQRRLAERNEDRANMNAEEAKRQELEAIKNAEIATRNEQIATEQRSEATRLRMVSIGKAMAIKSTQLGGQSDLQFLLAFQAYIFNKRNGGATNDADIYMGLYGVAKISGKGGYALLSGHAGSVKSISFVPGSTQFYTSGADGKILEWNLNSSAEGKLVYQGPEIAEIIAVSPDGKMLACGNDRAIIRLIPLSGAEGTNLQAHTGKVKSLVFTPDSRFLYSTGVDGLLIRWDLATGKSSTLPNQSGPLVSLDISPDGKLLASASAGGKVSLTDISGSSESVSVKTRNGPVNIVRFRNNGVLAIGFINGIIEIWDITKGVMITELKSHNVRVSDIRFNEGRRQMASCSMDGTVKMWNMDDLTEPPITLNDNNGFVMAIAYSPDGSSIISGNDSPTTNLIRRPVHADLMTREFCSLLSRNFTDDEWRRYVGTDINYEATCPDLMSKVNDE